MGTWKVCAVHVHVPDADLVKYLLICDKALPIGFSYSKCAITANLFHEGKAQLFWPHGDLSPINLLAACSSWSYQRKAFCCGNAEHAGCSTAWKDLVMNKCSFGVSAISTSVGSSANFHELRKPSAKYRSCGYDLSDSTANNPRDRLSYCIVLYVERFGQRLKV